MESLIRGIHKFQTTYFSSHQDLFQRLAKQQQPEALFISCSDSRVSPTMLTQSPPGEIFILRNAGNIVPPHGASNSGEAAAVEYGVSALGVRDIILCGHTRCGAMKALLHPEQVAGLPAVAAWLSHAEATRRIVKENYAELDDEARLLAAVKENVLVQLENLRTHPAVASGLARKEVHLHGWVYEIETGQVSSYDPAGGRFVPLVKAAEDEAADGASI